MSCELSTTEVRAARGALREAFLGLPRDEAFSRSHREADGRELLQRLRDEADQPDVRPVALTNGELELLVAAIRRTGAGISDREYPTRLGFARSEHEALLQRLEALQSQDG